MTWLEGTVIENRHWSEALFSLRVIGPRLSFQAGQFVRIALDIGAERQAFVHVRELMSGYVSDPSEVLKPAQEVEAKVIAVDRRKKRIDLSLKALDDFTPEDDEPEVKPMSTMEAALRAAMNSKPDSAERDRLKKPKAVSNDIEAVLERTRQQHLTKK